MYVVERWLARLSDSRYAEDFVLKGGMLLAAFGQRRPTVDADTLARNLANDAATVASRVAEIAALPCDDGVVFITGSVSATTIRDDALYVGVRVTMNARIATASVKLRLDVNFGDPVTPAPRKVVLPALRPDMPAVTVLGYPIETVLAEKIVTALDLGAANTRVRDYADIYTITGAHDLSCEGSGKRSWPLRTIAASTSRPWESGSAPSPRCEPAHGGPTGAASAGKESSSRRTSRTSSHTSRHSPIAFSAGRLRTPVGSPHREPGPRPRRSRGPAGCRRGRSGLPTRSSWRSPEVPVTPSVGRSAEGVILRRSLSFARR